MDKVRGMMDTLSTHGRKLVTIVDPHIKASHDYSVYTELNEKNMLLRKKHWEQIQVPSASEEELNKGVAKMIADPHVSGPPPGWDADADGPWEHPLVANPHWRR